MANAARSRLPHRSRAGSVPSAERAELEIIAIRTVRPEGRLRSTAAGEDASAYRAHSSRGTQDGVRDHGHARDHEWFVVLVRPLAGLERLELPLGLGDETLAARAERGVSTA